MTLTLTVALLGIVLEDTDFLALTILYYSGLHGCAGDSRRADGDAVAVACRAGMKANWKEYAASL